MTRKPNMTGFNRLKISICRMGSKLRYRFLFCILLGSMSLMLVDIVIYFYTKEILVSHEGKLMEDSLNLAVNQLDHQIAQYNNIADYVFADKTLHNVLNLQYDENYYEMHLAYVDVIEPGFLTYLMLHDELDKICLFTDNGMVRYKNYVRSWDREVMEGYGYDESVTTEDYQNIWYAGNDTGEINLIRRLFTPLGGRNYLLLSLDYDSFFSPLSRMSPDTYGIVIIDADGKIVYDVYEQPGEVLDTEIFLEGEQAFRKEYGNKYVMVTASTRGSMWTVYYYRPMELVVKAANTISYLFAFATLGCMLVFVILGTVLVRDIIAPIEALTDNMIEVRNGNLEVTVESRRRDEIGVMLAIFSEMIQRIRYLIQEVYSNKIRQKEFELKALRAQINPHFLYNSLSLINSRAIMAQQDDISRMTLLLSDFYRTALNHGRDCTTVGNEMLNTKSYIEMQLIMCNRKFKVKYDIDDDIMEVEMPNLILQPIVENAIEHGLKLSGKKEKNLRITGTRKNERIEISIEDNGSGITDERLEQIFRQDSKSYGIKNVSERLKLIYGETYGLVIESKVNDGTCIRINIPAPE